MIYPADYAQEQANLAYEKLLNAEEISSEMIPKFCDYIVFDTNGSVKAGDINGKGVERAWAAVQGSRSDIYGNYYTVVFRENEYCVLRYKIIPQYKDAFLQKYFLSPQMTILIIALLLIIISFACVAIRFGQVLQKKMNPLILATKKIQNQELEFPIETDNIKELNTVLVSMDKMRVALRNSLEKQWKMEQLRKEQISALAHDVKTPLTLIRGNAELLFDTNPTEEQLECIQYIEASSLQIQNYVQMLMEVTKSNDGIQVRISQVAIADFLQNIKKEAKGLCMVNNIQLRWDCKIETEKFYMGSSCRNSKLHYGMGLYIADSVAKQHGGLLVLENSVDTHGAKVIIKIPL